MRTFVSGWVVGAVSGLMLVSGAIASGPAGMDDRSDTLTVMTYNVLHGQPCAGGSFGSEVTPRMELAVAGGPGGEPGLAELSPDILGMQEVSQIFETQAIEDNQTCGVAAAIPFLDTPPGLEEVTAFEHQGDTLVRLLNGTVDASPYAMRFVRDNPRLLPLVDDAALIPPDARTLSDVSAEMADFEIGLGLITRFRIQQVTVHNLTIGEVPGETRAIMHATIQVRGSDGSETPIDFYDSHLTTTGGDSPQTVLMATEIARFIQTTRRHPERPGIFVCDCNATEGSTTYQVFSGAGFQDTFRAANPSGDGLSSGRDSLGTSCEEFPDGDGSRIDYVWQLPAASGELWEVASSGVVMNYSEPVTGGCRWPSDHNGVMTTFAP